MESPFFQVVANADDSLLVTLRLIPGARNDPIIDAAYAVLDELSGLNAPDNAPSPQTQGAA